MASIDGNVHWGSDLAEYRASPRERERVADLLALMPSSGAVALDVGARDGHLSRLLTKRYRSVVALDLVEPAIDDPRIECRRGDATSLPFADRSFDAVLCAEVLEHIPTPLLEKACSEIARVAKGVVVIGVPYRQDLRCGRTRCRRCGRINPPWGHVNAFDERRLHDLFQPLQLARTSYVGSTREVTNRFSAALMDFAGNPFGTYGQQEACIACNSPLLGPPERTRLQRIATRVAFVMDRLQRRCVAEHANWLHVRFDKTGI